MASDAGRLQSLPCFICITELIILIVVVGPVIMVRTKVFILGNTDSHVIIYILVEPYLPEVGIPFLQRR